MNENYIQKSSKRFTILRVAGLLDKSSRINSVQKIIANNNQRISLSSKLYFKLYSL